MNGFNTTGLLAALDQRGYIKYSKDFAKKYGLEAAILWGELISQFCYWDAKGMLKDDKWFFATIERLEAETTLSGKRQRKAIEVLTGAGLIETKLFGVPARKYFSINNAALIDLIFSDPNKERV